MKKRMTFTLDEEVLKKLKEVSDMTLIPQARIVEIAIKEQLGKMNGTIQPSPSPNIADD